MNRRELVHQISLLIGGAMSPHLVSAVMQHGSAEYSSPSNDEFRILDDAQVSFLRQISEIIIPQTDTPGAIAAGVTEFIDLMLHDWYPEDESQQFLTGLARLQRQCVIEFGDNFSDLPVVDQIAIAGRLDREAVRARGQSADPLPVFALIKELTLVGYYTSDIGMRDELKILGPIAEMDFGESGPPAGTTSF